MVLLICGVKLSDRVHTTGLYALLWLEEISSAVGTRRLRWYGDPLALMRLLERRKWRGREAVDGLKRLGTNV